MTGKIITIYNKETGYDLEILARPNVADDLIDVQICDKEGGEEKLVVAFNSADLVRAAKELLTLAEAVESEQKPKAAKPEKIESVKV